MGTLPASVRWTSSSPEIYFDFSYERQRVGSSQQYKITVSCRGLLTTGSYYGYPIKVQIFLDGVAKTAYTLKESAPQYWSSPITNTTGWLDVANKTTGETGLAIRIYCDNPNSKRDETYYYQLAVDPAASTITVASGTAIIEGYPTITINRASTSFTHTISYQFGSLRDTIVDRTSATTINSWQIPASFYSQIPDSKDGWGTLTCTTYSGSSPIGSYDYPFWVGTDEAKCKPTVSGIVVDTYNKTIAVTGDRSVLVRYRSIAMCALDAKLNNGAGSFSVRTVNNTPLKYDNINISNVEINTFDFYAKDSRGYFNSDKVVSTLIPYILLTNDATIQRDDPTSGNATLEIKGNYFNGSFGQENNTLTVKYRQGDGDYIPVEPNIADNRYSATVHLTGVDYDKAYNYEVVVEDKIDTVTKPLTVQKGIPVFDWGENDFNFNVPVTINGVNILEKLAELERRIS